MRDNKTDDAEGYISSIVDSWRGILFCLCRSKMGSASTAFDGVTTIPF